MSYGSASGRVLGTWWSSTPIASVMNFLNSSVDRFPSKSSSSANLELYEDENKKNQHCLSCFTHTERLWWRETQMLKLFLQGLPKYILELPPDMRTTWVIPLTDTVFTAFTLHSIPPHSIHSIHSTHSIHRVWIFSRWLPPPASPAAPQIQKIIHLSHPWLSLANL